MTCSQEAEAEEGAGGAGLQNAVADVLNAVRDLFNNIEIAPRINNNGNQQNNDIHDLD